MSDESTTDDGSSTDIPSPSDAIETDDAPSGGEADDGGDDTISVSDMLLETEPDESPTDYEGTPNHLAHGIIGIKKAVNSLMDGSMKRGVPAIQNFGMAAIGAFTATTDDSDDGDDAAETTTPGETV